MRRIWICLFALAVLLAGCAPQQGGEAPPMSSQAEAPAQVGGVSLDGFDTVGCILSRGISATPFPWMQSSRRNCSPCSSPINGWKLPRRRGPNTGFPVF